AIRLPRGFVIFVIHTGHPSACWTFADRLRISLAAPAAILYFLPIIARPFPAAQRSAIFAAPTRTGHSVASYILLRLAVFCSFFLVLRLYCITNSIQPVFIQSLYFLPTSAS